MTKRTSWAVRVKDWQQRASYNLRVVRGMQGQFPRSCNLCGYSGAFLATGLPPRYDAKCKKCRSVERHRLFALADDAMRLIRPDDSVLHFAPEPAIVRHLKARAGNYVSADIDEGRGDLRLDAEATNLPSDSYDVIVASHILEHLNDAAALREFHRILRDGGRAILMVPIIEQWLQSYEDSSLTTSAARTLHFGQDDHIRYYGRDFRDRVQSAGFSVREYVASPPECAKYGLLRGETIFVADKY